MRFGPDPVKKTPLWYRAIKKVLYWCYPKTRIITHAALPADAPVIFVGNHAQSHGPIVSELYFPHKRYTWCVGEMLHVKEVPAYAYQDFWGLKPRALRPLFKVLSYIIAPLALLLSNANTIAVYRDSRIVGTFKETVRCLEEGADIVIFPENEQKYNHILNEFQDKFIDIVRLYYRKTGKCLQFVPMYLAPKRRELHLGEPISFRPDVPMGEERARIHAALKQAITDMADSLPLHTVVPYANVSKKQYPKNHPHQ